MMDITSMLKNPIPIISNAVLVELLSHELITIDHFDPKCLAPTAYQLKPYRVRVYYEDEEGQGPGFRVFNLAHGTPYHLMPGEHISVTPQENIVLGKGFVADFYPSSWCVEKKLHLTLGRLDSGYKGELVFGVFNAGRDAVAIYRDFQLARMTLAWLGEQNMPTYGEIPPGAYITGFAKLRAKEDELAEDERVLDARKEQIRKAREELEKLQEQS